MSSSDSTEAVYNRHMQAFMGGDIEVILSNFTDQSVIITNQGVVSGLEQIRGFFSQVLESMGPEAIANTKMLTSNIEGDVAFHTMTQGAALPFAAETYVIRDGKIMTQTVGMYMPQ